MNLNFDPTVAVGYKSPTQIARRMTEDWMEHNMFCPICGHPVLNHYANNLPVADFFCPHCHADYELKSKRQKSGLLGAKINDGAYDTMIERIQSYNNPNFFFLNYFEGAVNDLWFVPNFFFVPSIIEKRKPLGEEARRAGWTGCEILVGDIPDSGKIQIVKNSKSIAVELVVAQYKRTESLVTKNLDSRGWLLDTLACVERLPDEYFSLDEMYAFANELQAKHPQNLHVQDKIRQQLQYLRDKGYIEFLGRGRYRKIRISDEIA